MPRFDFLLPWTSTICPPKERGEKETINTSSRFQAGFHSTSEVTLDREGHAAGGEEDANRSAVTLSWNLQPRYRTLRWADGLNLKPLRLFSFTIAHLEHYHTFLKKYLWQKLKEAAKLPPTTSTYKSNEKPGQGQSASHHRPRSSALGSSLGETEPLDNLST